MDESVPDSATAVYWRGILRTSMNAIYNPQALDSSSTLNSVHQLHHLMEAASAEKVKNTNQTTTSTSSNFDSLSKSEHELNQPSSFVKNRKNTINSSQKNHSSPKDTCKLFKFPSSSWLFEIDCLRIVHTPASSLLRNTARFGWLKGNLTVLFCGYVEGYSYTPTSTPIQSL